MRAATRVACLVGLIGTTGPDLAAQRLELGGAVVGTSRPVAGGVVGPSLGLRVSRRDRVVVNLGLGTREAGLMGRSEIGWQVLLDPTRREGVSPFAGAGMALERDTTWRELVMVEVGVAVRPGAGPGWTLSLGLGGGFRLMASHRWRIGPPPEP